MVPIIEPGDSTRTSGTSGVSSAQLNTHGPADQESERVQTQKIYKTQTKLSQELRTQINLHILEERKRKLTDNTELSSVQKTQD